MTEPAQRPRLDLSPIQVIGGGLAAATAAAVGSRLGTAGTIIGAALISIIAAVAGAVYTHTMRRTSEAARAALVRRTGRPAVTSAEADSIQRTQGQDSAPRDAEPMPFEATQRPFPIRSVAIGTLAAFALAAVLVVGLEFVSGASLAGTGGGTTVGDVVRDGGGKPAKDGDRDPRSGSDPDSEDPSQQPSEEPSDQPSELPGDEPTEPHSEQPSEEPTEQPSEDPGQETDQPSDEPTEQPSEESGDDQGEEPSDQPSDESHEEPHADSPPSDR